MIDGFCRVLLNIDLIEWKAKEWIRGEEEVDEYMNNTCMLI